MDGECVKLQRTLAGKKKTSTSPTCREIPLIKKTGWGTIERETDGQKEKEGGRMQCFMKKKDRSRIENVETDNATRIKQ